MHQWKHVTTQHHDSPVTTTFTCAHCGATSSVQGDDHDGQKHAHEGRLARLGCHGDPPAEVPAEPTEAGEVQ